MFCSEFKGNYTPSFLCPSLSHLFTHSYTITQRNTVLSICQGTRFWQVAIGIHFANETNKPSHFLAIALYLLCSKVDE